MFALLLGGLGPSELDVGGRLRRAADEAPVARQSDVERIDAGAELAGHLLVGGTTARHEHDVKGGEAADGQDEHARERDEHDGDDARRARQVLLVEHHEPQAHAQYDEYVRGERDQELQEVLVVAARDTIAHPLITYIYNKHSELYKL